MKDKYTKLFAGAGLAAVAAGFIAFWGGVIYLLWAAGSFLMGTT